jgi:hypothetical protein
MVQEMPEEHEGRHYHNQSKGSQPWIVEGCRNEIQQNSSAKKSF